MVVNSAIELLPAQLEAGLIPIGTPLQFSSQTVMNNEGNVIDRGMREGILVGCDILGGVRQAIVQRRNESGEPYGKPKVITPLSLANGVELIMLDPDAEISQAASAYTPL